MCSGHTVFDRKLFHFMTSVNFLAEKDFSFWAFKITEVFSSVSIRVD